MTETSPNAEEFPPRVPDVHSHEELFSERLDTRRAAAHLGRSVRTLELWRSRGKGPPVHRLSRKRMFYLRKELDEFLAKAEVPDEEE